MFQKSDNSKTLSVMFKTTRVFHQKIKHFFAAMTKRSVTKIVGEGNCFRKIFIELKCSTNGSRNLCDFKCMGESRAIVITFMIDENLSLIFKPTKSLAMNNSIAIALKCGAIRILRFWLFSSAAVAAFLSI